MRFKGSLMRSSKTLPIIYPQKSLLRGGRFLDIYDIVQKGDQIIHLFPLLADQQGNGEAWEEGEETTGEGKPTAGRKGKGHKRGRGKKLYYKAI